MRGLGSAAINQGSFNPWRASYAPSAKQNFLLGFNHVDVSRVPMGELYSSSDELISFFLQDDTCDISFSENAQIGTFCGVGKKDLKTTKETLVVARKRG